MKKGVRQRMVKPLARSLTRNAYRNTIQRHLERMALIPGDLPAAEIDRRYHAALQEIRRTHSCRASALSTP